MEQRRAAVDRTRQQIFGAARKLLLAGDFSGFTMEAVARRADVSRLTVYYQFESKAGLLEALYNHIARRGHMQRLAQVFGKGGDPLTTLGEFIEVFVGFWASDRRVIRRLHALGGIDSEVGNGLRQRNERRRRGLIVIVDRYGRTNPLNDAQRAEAIDTLHMLTSFESFDKLANGRCGDKVADIIKNLARKALAVPD